MVPDFICFNFFLTFWVLVFVMFLGGWIRTYFFRKQLLLRLVRLEFLVLSLFLGFVSFLGCVGGFLCVTFYFLVLGACEATLGLCLLVNFVRLFGRDMLSSVNLVKC